MNTQLQTLSYDDLERLIKTKESAYHNFYNADIPIITYYAVQYYLRHPHDTIDNQQQLTKLFLDIEIYGDEDGIDDFTNANYVVNAITLCCNNEKVFRSYYLLNDQNFTKFGITPDPNFNFQALITDHIANFRVIMIEKGYITEEFNFEIYLFNDEMTLVQSFWQELHRIDPDIISGWNSDYFDMPYLYNRTKGLFGIANTNKLISKFGHVTYKDGRISIPEFIIADLLYLYKPRDEGGLNLGKKQAQYTLDNISEIELGLKKLEYKDKTMNLNTLYIDDPVYFLLYNIIDVSLVVNLDAKLKHIDLYNLIRRIMRTPFGGSISGSSVTFDTFIYSELTEQGQFIRYGINNEGGKNIEPEDVNHLPMLKDKKGGIMSPAKIPAKTFSNIITRYPGAFVKIPQPKVINNGSMVIDLDAASLYPSMILQANISFDSYHGRIIPVCTYKTIDLLSQCLGKQPIPQQLFTNLEKLVWNYADNKVKNQKTQTANTMYYMLVRMFDLLSKSGLTLQQIFQPTTTQESIILRTVFIPLIDLINMIHPQNPGYSTFTYDYLFVNEAKFKSKYQGVYIIHNAGETNTNIVGYTLDQSIPVIRKYIITLAGTLFQKHKEHMGLFTNFLNRMGNLRKMYKGMRQTSEAGSYEYTLNDNRQASVKVIMNTTYGLYGLSSFRYSNHWLAQSITNNGEMTIKLAQVVGDQHLIYKYGDLRG